MRHDSEGVSFLLALLAFACSGFLFGVFAFILATEYGTTITMDMLDAGVLIAVAVVFLGVGLYLMAHAVLLAFLPYRNQEGVHEHGEQVQDQATKTTNC